MVEYRWKQYDPVNILNMELAEFDLTKTEYSIEDVEYVAGIHHYRFRIHRSGLNTPGIFLVMVFRGWGSVSTET